MINHSIAPWKVEQSRPTEYTREIKDAQGELIAEVCAFDDEVSEAVANARLIAAAPDLLAALSELLPLWENGIEEPWIIRARAAIAKATGV